MNILDQFFLFYFNICHRLTIFYCQNMPYTFSIAYRYNLRVEFLFAIIAGIVVLDICNLNFMLGLY